MALRSRWIVSGGLAAVGLVWIGQGLGLIRGSSFMVDDPRWAVVGVALLVAAGAVGWTASGAAGLPDPGRPGRLGAPDRRPSCRSIPAGTIGRTGGGG